jgi:hypothetical protein
MVQRAELIDRFKNISYSTTCPEGAIQLSSEHGTKGGGITLSNGILTINSQPLLSNLLKPSHFYKILNGNCKGTKADNYNECAEFAYASPPCNIPMKCTDEAFYLGVQ